MKKETKTATQTAVPEKPAAPERVHGLDLISKYRLFCKCWGSKIHL